jgi:S1-C subfamily serine protease
MDDPTPTRRRFLELGGTAALGSIAGCNTDAPSAGTGSPRESRSPTTAPSDHAVDAPGPSEATAVDSPYARVYRQAVGSVVQVRTDGGRGTGFVAEPSHVVTNAHVVEDASAVDVRFSEGRWSEGDVVGTDPRTDLAVIELPESAPKPEPLSFAAADPTVGQEVVAIGNPFDLDGTLTTGVVSGVDRSAPAPTGAQIPDAIQTDAAINPGNSGGPLMSLDGRVVAVINSETGENIGFGISAALARRVVPRLVENGSYDHSFLGVTLAGVTPDLARALGLSGPQGVLVTSVLDDGPSAGRLRGGTETHLVDGARVSVGGDVLLSIDGETLRTTEDLSSHLALETRPGDTATLTVRRDGYVTSVDVELGTRPE